MRILQLIDSLNSGGAERMCINIANVLHENGYKVVICASRAAGPLENFISQGVNLYILRKKNSLDIAAFRKFLKIIRSSSIDVIHAHSSSLFWAIAAKLFTRNLRVIWHDHLGLKVSDRKTNRMYRLVSGQVDAIISVNDELAEWSRKNMKLSDERIQVLNNFSLLALVPHQSNPDYFTVVCLANIRPQKNHATLIRAIDIVSKFKLPKKLRVILAGSYDEGEYFNGLKSLVNELRLNEIIEFRGPVEDTATLLASSDCGVLSSISEGLPVALLEYGIAGLPVVVTDVGRCAEVTGDGKYGQVVQPDDQEAMADALREILENRDQAFIMGSAFRKHVLEKYGPTQFMDKYHTLLARI